METFTVKDVYEALVEYLRQRTDIGMRKGVLDCVLEPASPFDSKKSMRSPKRWFVLLALLAVSTFACFVYFNRLS